jgi:predicted nucleic acid-binding protein
MISHLEPKRVDRVFLDANVLFSAGYKSISSLRKLWGLTDVELLTSSYAVEEAYRNLAIHKPDQLESLEQLVDALTVVAEPAEGLSLPTEVDLVEKDRPILLAAIAARATHLLTGDIDVLPRFQPGDSPTAPQICDAVTLDLQKTGLERYPAQRAFPRAPLQPSFATGLSLGHVLPADRGYGIGVHAQLGTGTSTEVDQLKRRGPVFVTAQRQRRDCIAEMPDGVTGPTQTAQVLAAWRIFDPVAEGEHRHYLMPSRLALSRMASSSTAAWLMLNVSASKAKSRLASGLRRTLVKRLVSIAQNGTQYALHCNPVGLAGQGAFLPGLKSRVSCALFLGGRTDCQSGTPD